MNDSQEICNHRLCHPSRRLFLRFDRALGLSLKRLAFDTRLTSSISYMNADGLPRFFNAHITEENRSKILLFTHDDVWIDDYFVVDRLQAAVNTFDLVGVAGSTRRLPRQPAWWYINEQFEWEDRSYLTGAIAHGSGASGEVSNYGPAPRLAGCSMESSSPLRVTCCSTRACSSTIGSRSTSMTWISAVPRSNGACVSAPGQSQSHTQVTAIRSLIPGRMRGQPILRSGVIRA